MIAIQEVGSNDLAESYFSLLNDLKKDLELSFPKGVKPIDLITSGDPRKITGYCGTLAGPTVAKEFARKTGRPFRSVRAINENRSTHCYLVEEPLQATERDWNKDVIVDPRAGQYFGQRSKWAESQFTGTMFIGTRGDLKKIVTDPETELIRCSTASDKLLSFERIWGDQSEVWGLINPEEFYAS